MGTKNAWLLLAALAVALLGAFSGSAQAADSTQTTFTCTNTQLVMIGGVEFCKVAVKDVSASRVPTGVVSFTSNHAGEFFNTATNNNTCNLKTVSGSSNTSTCETAYFPQETGPDAHHTLTGEYQGTSNFGKSIGQVTIELAHTTGTALTCKASDVRTQPVTCEVAVLDQITALPPSGTVSIGIPHLPSKTCALTAVFGGESTCTFSFSPALQGTKKEILALTAEYQDDASHERSRGSATATIRGASRTGIVCQPQTQVLLGATAACTITVEGPVGETPSGSATLTSTAPGTFPDGSNSCPLVATTANLAACTVRFQPSGDGRPGLTGSFTANADLDASSATTSFQVIRQTDIVVDCVPGELIIGETVTCAAIVDDPLGGPAAEALPTGEVRFSTDRKGTFSAGAKCILQAGACAIDFTPEAISEPTIIATYVGDPNHLASQGAAAVLVQRPGERPTGEGPLKGEPGPGPVQPPEIGTPTRGPAPSPRIGPPDTKIKKKPHRKTTALTAKFSFLATQPGSRFQCKLDKGKFKPCRSPLTLKKLKVGGHTLRVRAVDPQGLVDPTPAKFRWKVEG